MLASNSMSGSSANPRANRWISCLTQPFERDPTSDRPILVGVLPGEGIGPEVTACALQVIEAATAANERELVVEYGGPIGRESEATCGEALSNDVSRFCESIFERGGAILSGAGGGRFVYDLRRRFDLFFKISPLQAGRALLEASRVDPASLRGLDILITRENSGGIYQGVWGEYSDDRPATHRFEYASDHVERFLQGSAKLAAARGKNMTVVWKESGVPSISRLWRDCAEQAASQHDIHFQMIDVDLMAYRLIQDPLAFDVVATPNLFGDVLGDLGAVLLGSRGVSFSGNYNGKGHAVYQTNHGAAYDLAGTDRANPIGQIFSAAMMLRESFGLFDAAHAIETAVHRVWQDGYRTEDLATPGSRRIGTKETSRRIAEHVMQCLQNKSAA